jgi:hypothetical protein
MTTDTHTARIRITRNTVRRETLDGETIGHGETGDVRRTTMEALCGRLDAVRVDGCQATTRADRPCTRDADDGDYCQQHRGDDGE